VFTPTISGCFNSPELIKLIIASVVGRISSA
jgi:hypothetical protein